VEVKKNVFTVQAFFEVKELSSNLIEIKEELLKPLV